MKDLSNLARDSMTVTSQAGGNMSSSNEQAMTAPGSEPVDPLPDREHQGDPKLDIGPEMAVGTDGKRQPGTGYTPAPRQWKTTGA